MKKGQLIVIDGSDGSGKATQTALLAKRLKKEGYTVRTLDFPQYDKNFFGKFVQGCLHGRYGDFITINPYVASVLYAADRFESKEKIQKWLKQGDIVLLDRYVSANQIHQGGKITNTRKRSHFLRWLEEMEHDVFGLPYPDQTLYLDVPVSVSQELLQNANKKTDDVENDVDYLTNSRKSALWLARQQENWVRIKCVKGRKLRSIEDIHEEIYDVVTGN